MKECKRCGLGFGKRQNERPGRYAERIFCSRNCSDQAKTEASREALHALFESNLSFEPNSGCWLWIGMVTRGGYGRIRVAEDRLVLRAHRFSYVTAFGPIPLGKHVLHKCDTPACVNPEHLYLGTDADNAKDRVNRNRVPKGPSHWTRREKSNERSGNKRPLQEERP